MSEWQPISTAPRDGTHVDLWIEIRASLQSFGMGDSFRVPDCWCSDRGTWNYHVGYVIRSLQSDHVTHWMPLPAPPDR